MRLKATWSLLLLLLVSVQAFAAACDVRCGAMVGMNSANHMSSMAHCPGMASQSVSAHQAILAIAPSQPCASQICRNDWTLFQSPVLHGLGVSPLTMSASGHAVIPVQIANSLQFKVDRNTHTIPHFDPLISTLRV